MSILSDFEIASLCLNELELAKWYNKHAARNNLFQLPLPAAYLPLARPMITPYEPNAVREIEMEDGEHYLRTRKILSYGSSGFGYDVRLAREFKIFTNLNAAIIDPKRFDNRCLATADILQDPDGSEYVILPPNSYLLGSTVEKFDIPNDIMVVCVGKSTYARCGAIVNVTPIEPGFRGNVVIEISNSTSLPLKIYANEGISQFMFFRGRRQCVVSYADKNGKYQDQTGITLPKA